MISLLPDNLIEFPFPFYMKILHSFEIYGGIDPDEYIYI